MNIDFDKHSDQLVPAIVQDANTKTVLMLGYMSEEAWETTLEHKRVTFYSRSKKRLWTKGEESGNFLELVAYRVDCDNDTLLLEVNPAGPVCHKGTDTCWGEENRAGYGFLSRLEEIIHTRKTAGEPGSSYVASLFESGINKIAQKVGEEAVETVIEAKDNNGEAFLAESADLLFHYLVLLQAKGFRLEDIAAVLQERHKE